MAGIALGRLWDTHPRIALPVHLFTCGLIGWAIIAVWGRVTWIWIVVFATIFVIDLGSVAFFAYDAARRGWRPDRTI